MKHEANNPAVRDSAQVSGGHAQVTHIVRKKLSSERQKDRKRSGEQERDSGHRERWSSVSDQLAKQASVFMHR
jgi:hypothetical protein